MFQVTQKQPIVARLMINVATPQIAAMLESVLRNLRWVKTPTRSVMRRIVILMEQQRMTVAWMRPRRIRTRPAVLIWRISVRMTTTVVKKEKVVLTTRTNVSKMKMARSNVVRRKIALQRNLRKNCLLYELKIVFKIQMLLVQAIIYIYPLAGFKVIDFPHWPQKCWHWQNSMTDGNLATLTITISCLHVHCTNIIITFQK